MSQCAIDAASRLARGRTAAAIGAVFLALSAVAGCSTAEIDKLPKEYGGLPEGAPRRSESPPAYPAVHDMPPDRAKALLDPDEQKRLEADLAAARNRLQSQQKNQLQKNQAKDAQQAPAERAAARSDRPTVKRGQRPTALPGGNEAQESRPKAGRSQTSRAPEQPAAAPANPQSGGGAPAWPAPPGPDATGFGRNP